MEISDKVLRVLESEHITAEELSQMVTHAAVTRIRDCNRRFHHWIFRVQGDHLWDMQRAEMLQIGLGNQFMFEPHEACEGKGCRTCGWIGLVARAIGDNTASSLDKY